MPISYRPMREFMKEHNFSYYYLANQGIEAPTLQRIRHDEPLSTQTIEKLCKIMNCQPSDLLEYIDEENNND